MNPQEQKIHFESGASSSGNVPPYECLTITFLTRCAERMRLGLHYGKHNWKKGTQDKQFILDRLNHAFAHLVKAQAAIDMDQPSEDDDLAAIAVNCMFAMEYEYMRYKLSPNQSKEPRNKFQEDLFDLIKYMPDTQTQEIIDYIVLLRDARRK